ncbi:hypothetical protein SAMD00023353_3800050 [Rosellinia necatrix]|uniref:Uncharacterized protein n=1 Tax=Rosellinia necatrix TaxID=77044 RepID=A0A1W2TME0_ROSNE|nr:hypothetical protein SAMD00023353_3800050 [Rosellinia necatrix]
MGEPVRIEKEGRRPSSPDADGMGLPERVTAPPAGASRLDLDVQFLSSGAYGLSRIRLLGYTGATTRSCPVTNGERQFGTLNFAKICLEGFF